MKEDPFVLSATVTRATLHKKLHEPERLESQVESALKFICHRSILMTLIDEGTPTHDARGHDSFYDSVKSKSVLSAARLNRSSGYLITKHGSWQLQGCGDPDPRIKIDGRFRSNDKILSVRSQSTAVQYYSQPVLFRHAKCGYNRNVSVGKERVRRRKTFGTDKE